MSQRRCTGRWTSADTLRRQVSPAVWREALAGARLAPRGVAKVAAPNCPRQGPPPETIPSVECRSRCLFLGAGGRRRGPRAGKTLPASTFDTLPSPGHKVQRASGLRRKEVSKEGSVSEAVYRTVDKRGHFAAPSQPRSVAESPYWGKACTTGEAKVAAPNCPRQGPPPETIPERVRHFFDTSRLTQRGPRGGGRSGPTTRRRRPRGSPPAPSCGRAPAPGASGPRPGTSTPA
jgi:hypothetical protein